MLRCRVARLGDYFRVRRKGFEALDLHRCETSLLDDFRLCLLAKRPDSGVLSFCRVVLALRWHLPHQLTNADFLLRPACLVSNRRGVDVNGAANNPRICTIYRTIIYFYIAQFVACSVCAQSAKYHAILCCFALLRIGLYWRGSSWGGVTRQRVGVPLNNI